eukprot:gnl/TRDRNA2_/TRDRNA2_145116_c0_seq1.p1 gnl/TRDRNA2_/TRDRNA2_145116_c0~~gnl/TRDRNA2_/TRDRNA2_145116_c0_seq1.p1  ORF type:complete len:139 (-),score=6.49 gnl/TRDRNA2_/TRDRNA2_145116_c0_seq1:37-453(-)
MVIGILPDPHSSRQNFKEWMVTHGFVSEELTLSTPRQIGGADPKTMAAFAPFSDNTRHDDRCRVLNQYGLWRWWRSQSAATALDFPTWAPASIGSEYVFLVVFITASFILTSVGMRSFRCFQQHRACCCVQEKPDDRI